MDQMQKARDTERLKQAVGQFVGIPEQFLSQALGRELTLEDLMEFICLTSAEFLSHMYGMLRTCAGHEEAEKWLRKTLGVASAAVRVSGQDVLLKFDVTTKIVPNTLHKRDPEKEAAQAQRTLQKDLPCACALDQDGRCAVCARKLSTQIDHAFEQLIRLQEIADKEKADPTCVACNDTQFDYAISLTVPKFVRNGEKGQMALSMIYSMAQQAGGKPIPLTEKAWLDESAKLKEASPS